MQFHPSETDHRCNVPLAVIGMGCRMPGADSIDEYWRLLRDGNSAIIDLPPERLDRDLYYDPREGTLGKSYSLLGGIVPERPIDRERCPLPEELIQSVDVAHLTMCEVAADACRHAGMDPFNLPLRKTGVYIGHSGGSCLGGEIAYSTYIEEIAEYLKESATFAALPPDVREASIRELVERVHREKPHRSPDGGPELGAHAVSALISEAFDLNGPFMAIDAACASSLIAVALGAQALQQGLVDMAIVGGASYSKWYGFVLFSQAQSMSATGSRPFDADADGLISSDGYAAVILKTLPRAIADGDRILSVIRGIGISSDGRGKSLWAPRKEGQVYAIHRAYQHHVDPAHLQYIECHATSTQVGDATELGALSLALRDRVPAGSRVPIGSVKANIGHTLEAAGIAGFVKTVLAMKHRIIPPQINFRTPNPQIDWEHIPFYVPTQAETWPEPAKGHARRAAVNAFGIGGLNVHVVLDDAPSAEDLCSSSNNGRGSSARAVQSPASSPSIRVATASEVEDSIAVIGMGAIFPGALTIEAFWDLLESGRDPKCDAPPDRWNANIYCDPQATGPRRCQTKLGGYVTDFEYDWKKHKVPPKQIANANPLQFMLLDAADQALCDAGYLSKSFDRSRASVVVGTVFGGDFGCHLQMGLRLPESKKLIRETLKSHGIPSGQIDAVAEEFSEVLLTHMPALRDETGSFTSSTLASRLTKTFDLMGGAFALDSGDTSSLAAISAAMGLLRSSCPIGETGAA